ncbi:Prominin-1 [Chionoecetes opilio]|uniref:Prominin-1 n=1 Tax=Chionoecetes opilio TaxID=41210 RepID=A0A8J5CV89_CHIOP|nr:Prominin-1 [Chionoecetes opilio]
MPFTQYLTLTTIHHLPESLVAQELAQVTLDQQQAMRVVSELEANWDVLLIHYIGLAALVALGALVVVVMPLAGLVFACCRCAGRCGAQEPHYDKKRDPCKRVTLGTLLAVLVVVILLGLVCSFVTNARMEEGVQSLPKEWSVSVHDTKLFLNNTDNEVQNLLVRNYRELQSVLYNKLDSSGELVKSELARVTKAVAIDNLTAIASSLSVIKKDLWEIKNTTLQLQEQTSNLRSGESGAAPSRLGAQPDPCLVLQAGHCRLIIRGNFLQKAKIDGLEDVASRLKELYNSCENLPECRQLITKYSDKLTINNDFDRLPNVEAKLDEVTSLIENDIEIVVKRGKRSFDSIATEIQNKVQRSIPEIKAKIVDVGDQLEDAAEKIHRYLQPVDLSESKEPNAYPQEPNKYMRQIDDYLKQMQDGINEYAMYRYWGSMGLCILLLVITLCFTLGVVFGCCGRRPDEASSCHKSTGASWLMCGVGLTFLFSAVIMACTTILFVVGSASEILVCDPLRDPMHSEVFSVASDFYNLEHMYPPGKAPRLNEIISNCHRNLSLHAVLSLDNVESNLAELQDYKNRLNLHEKVRTPREKINRPSKI